MLFKFKAFPWECGVVMHVKTVGGIVRQEFVCDLPKRHEGNHHGVDKVRKETLTWVNNDKFYNDSQREPPKANERKIILPWNAR
jgi:hypothetical protein